MIRRNRTVSALAGVLTLGLAVSACGGGGAADTPGVNADDKVIMLGTISSLSGPFAGVGEPLTAGQAAFWETVNDEGGLDGWTVDVTTHVKDSAYDVTAHAQAFNEIKGDVLLILQSLGTAHTNAILEDAMKDNMLVGPASLGSNWIWDEAALQFATSYCADAMNAVDFAVQQGAESVAVVHLPGDAGDDAMVGARIAAEAHGITFTAIETATVSAGDDQTAAIGEVLQAQPDMLLVAASPQELATVVGGMAANDFATQVIGSVPTWNAALLGTPAAPALEAMYMQATSFPVWGDETVGQAKMRAAAEAAGIEPNDWFAIGFASGYVMKAILEEAIANDSLTREGIYEIAQNMTGIDSEGTLPEGTGNYAAEPNDQAARVTQLNAIDTDAESGIAMAVEPFVGPTAEGYEFTEPCYEMK